MKSLIYRIFNLLLVSGIFLSITAFAQKTKKPVSRSAAKTQTVADSKNSSKTTIDTKSDLSAMEIAVIEEINEARTDPQKFLGYLEDLTKSLKGNVMYPPNSNGIVMIEGAAAIDDAVKYVKTVPKLDALNVSGGLFKTANLQLTDLEENANLRHMGKNGSTLPERLMKFGFAGANTAENICYKVAVARDVVLTMILDDGVNSRSHRKNIFSPLFKQIGVACGTGNNGDALCVAVFADSFTDKN